VATDLDAGTTTRGTSTVADLQAFLDGERPDRRSAFDRLANDARRFLSAYLRRVCPATELLHDDVVQEALLRVWAARDRLEDRGPGAWYCLLKRVADRCHIDAVRTRAHQAELQDETPEDVPDDDEPLIDAIARALDTEDAVARIRREADTLWLGVPPDLSDEERERRRLALHLLYVDRFPWQDVVRMLGEPAPSRRELDDWARDPATIRLAAFDRLHMDGEALAAWMQDAARSRDAWSEAERTVLAWRLARGLTLDQIERRSDCPLNHGELAALDDRWRALLPFESWMRELVSALQTARVAGAPAVLSELGLWQRLAFAYRYADELPHRDIHDRTAPPASVVGRTITMGMLNVWLSNARLVERLARRLAAGTEENCHERPA